ncbi:MAG: peptide MFS transporter [Planctomycetes bacterium]|nr:peptide MFS transporter [Planctomycetota bacterium]
MIQDDHESTAIGDVKQLGLFAAIASLGYVFWVVGGMEMIERLAFYGVKAVATLYAKDPVSAGGLGVELSKFGTLLMVWAFVQSFVPIFTGGLSDRYGYKETIFLSTVLKIIGYLIMAWYGTYWGFFAGAIVLATGTAIFKPGIQGTLVRVTDRRNSSVAWGAFYQMVNIGGFFGPLVAALLRKIEWAYVFYACAAIISLNFILLLTYREAGKEERLERNRRVRAGEIARPHLAAESIRELLRPHVWTYLLVFSGFWFMFNALFDVLPAHIDDWVDTSDIVETLFPSGPSENRVVNFLVPQNKEGTAILPEGMLNINAGLIMITCVFFAHLSGMLRATTSLVVGTLFASAAMFASGWSTVGWISVGAISIFSVGEMLSSPKFSEFIGNFAPRDKKAMYLGFSQIPLAIGWTLESQIGLTLYDRLASKDRFSRELLTERHDLGELATPAGETLETLAGKVEQTPEAMLDLYRDDFAGFVEGIPQGEAFDWLIKLTGEAPGVLSDTLYGAHNVGLVWYIMGGVGVVSAIGIWIYGKWILTLKTAE